MKIQLKQMIMGFSWSFLFMSFVQQAAKQKQLHLVYCSLANLWVLYDIKTYSTVLLYSNMNMIYPTIIHLSEYQR